MAFLFGRGKQRGHSDLCKAAKDQLSRLAAGLEQKGQPRIEEELAKNLSLIKVALQGTPDLEASPDQTYQAISHLIAEDVLPLLAANIWRLPFESRKDAHIIFSNLLRFKLPGQDMPYAMSYLADKRPDIMVTVCYGYDHIESAMPCGNIMREALRHEAIAAIILYDEPGQKMELRKVDSSIPASGNGVFWKFFEWIDKGAFEVSADAFSTFRELFTRQKKYTAHFLQVNMNMFVHRYNNIFIRSSSYVTKRQSLNLLAALLLERTNYSLMTQYIASPDNLKLIMQQLKDDRRMVNYEAFHIFKVFVANPHKAVAIQRILINNKQKLLAFLPDFLNDRSEDGQFMEEKSYCISMIESLPAQPVTHGEPRPQVQAQAPARAQNGQAGQAGVGLGRGAVAV